MDQTSHLGEDSYKASPSAPQESAPSEAQHPFTIPVIEERVYLDKKVVEKGSVRIIKEVHEHQVPVSIPLAQEEHDIQRVPVNEYVDTPPPPIRYEGDTMIIPIVQEVMVVQKRLMVVEELHITKNKVYQEDIQQVNLRKEEIRVERISQDTTGHSNGTSQSI